jgi:septal ring factor EnvC (AmiA/AmiB activator)
VDNYISIIKKEIVNLTLNIEELRNRLSELKNSYAELEINEDLTKVQKKLSLCPEGLSKREKSILDCENEIENLYSEKSKKESELENFLDNKTRFSIVDLMKLVDFSKLPPKKIINTSKFIRVQQSYNKGQNRRYCSICFKKKDRKIISSLLFKPSFQGE